MHRRHAVGQGLAFTHYSQRNDGRFRASLSDKKPLRQQPAVFTIVNTNSTPEDFYFGLPVLVTPEPRQWGLSGYRPGRAALAVQSGSCELLSGTRLTSVFNSMTQGFAFHGRSTDRPGSWW
jgi:hypothetical protein